MKDMLPPGTYDAFIQAATPVRGSGKNGLRFKLALANAVLLGTVMYEIRLSDFNQIESRLHPWDSYVRAPRSCRERHHKAKAQPNRGPRGNNPW